MDVLEREDLHDVVLVGHSYGGMVISGVAELAAGRLSHLVFLDAFVPEDGQSLFDLLRPERRDLYLRAAEEHGEGWQVPAPPPQVWGITDEVQVARLAGRLTPQPLRTFEEPVRLKDPAASAPDLRPLHRRPARAQLRPVRRACTIGYGLALQGAGNRTRRDANGTGGPGGATPRTKPRLT